MIMYNSKSRMSIGGLRYVSHFCDVEWAASNSRRNVKPTCSLELSHPLATLAAIAPRCSKMFSIWHVHSNNSGIMWHLHFSGKEVGDPLGEERALELMAKLRAAQGKMDGALEARAAITITAMGSWMSCRCLLYRCQWRSQAGEERLAVVFGAQTSVCLWAMVQ